MTQKNLNEPMLEMYIYETSNQALQLEQMIIENESQFDEEQINEIFRIMHTIKGSSAMMLFNHISQLAHAMEDLMFFIREKHPTQIDYSVLTDLLLEGLDYVKAELEKIKNGIEEESEARDIIEKIKAFLELLKKENTISEGIELPASKRKEQYYIRHDESFNDEDNNAYKAIVFFEEGCEMEDVRAYSIVRSLKEMASNIIHEPKNVMDDEESAEEIKKNGFTVLFASDKSYDEIHFFFMQTVFLKELKLEKIEKEVLKAETEGKKVTQVEEAEIKIPQVVKEPTKETKNTFSINSSNIMSVNVSKLDHIMNLIEEMVIAEAMVVQNPDLNGLKLNNFTKAARQLSKITSELQDQVMSIRMIPISSVFVKMQRIVRDMSKKLDKDIDLELIGEDTEIDKKIVEFITDPLMHMVRNAIDHGIESTKERIEKGKDKKGTVILEARNEGNEVLIIVKDDGKGLNKEGILNKARQNGLLQENDKYLTDEEVYNLIFLPGFSTKEAITEFSGRGVGTDVVKKNIEEVGGTITVKSTEGKGSSFIIRIPLTLAIIDGMNIRVGKSLYTLPITAIKESFRPLKKDIIVEPNGNEMIMIRGYCYSIIRLHKYYNVEDSVTEMSQGILIMIEYNGQKVCLFADELLGQQQVVVKMLPQYIKNMKKVKGLAGCTLLGDGSISLILDTAEFF